MIINLDSPTDLSGFYVVYEGSVNNEEKGTRGLSHLMEHLMTKNLEEYHDEFDIDGIKWNALTSNDKIVFYMIGLNEKVLKHFKKFYNSLRSFDISENQLEKEKAIVLEEYGDTFSDPMNSHMMNLFRYYFNWYGPIGHEDDIKETTLDDCVEYFDKQFKHPSKIVFISNDREVDETDGVFADSYENRDVEYFDYSGDPDLDLTNPSERKSSIFFTTPIIKEDFYKVEFLTKMLGHGLSSPLYQVLREENGLAYGIYCTLTRFNEDHGIGVIASETSTSKVRKFKEEFKNIASDPDEHLTEDRFNVIKRYFKSIYKMRDINKYKDPYPHLDRGDWDLRENLDDLEHDDIMEVYEKYFDPDDIRVSVNTEETWEKPGEESKEDG